MNDEETLASDFEDVTYEAAESSESYGDIIINNPGRIEINGVRDSEEESSETEIFLEEFENPKNEAIVNDVTGYTVTRSDTRSLPDFRNVWKLTVDNTEYTVLFPDGSNLVVVNGKLYNRGSSTITGVILDNNFSDTSFFERTISILPLASSSTQNSVYRYGSRIYITTYSAPSQGYNLITSVNYIQVSSVERPSGWQLSSADLVICGLLLFSVLVSIIGGLLRR